MKKLKLPKEVKEKLDKELDRLYKMPPMMAESAVIRNYLDTVLSLPWGKMPRDNYDLKKAAAVLDKDHYGLKKVKERILDYLAVRAPDQEQSGTHHLPGGTSGRWQDQPGPEHCPGCEPEIHPDFSGWNSG